MTNKLPGDPDQSENRRLNIFALPSQTAILTGLIIFVVYGTMIGLAASAAPFPVGWFLLGLLVLSVRAWIAWPEQIQRQYDPQPAGQDFPALQALMHDCSKELGLTHVPTLMLVQQAKPFTYGGWRRRYILIGREQAQDLENLLGDSASSDTIERSLVKAILFHELHHYKHGDNQWLGYTNALLWTGFKFIGWALLLILGWALLAELVTPDLLRFTPDEIIDQVFLRTFNLDLKPVLRPLLPSLEDWQAMQKKATTLNIALIEFYTVLNMLPLALTSALLALFLWLRLLRFREFYADAGVVHTQHTASYLWEAEGLVGTFVDMYADRNPLQRWRYWIKQARISIGLLVKPIVRKIKPILSTLGNGLSYHPSGERRIQCLRDPDTMYDPWWKTGFLIGLFALIVDILLTGTSLVIHIGGWPMHFPVLAIFLLLSLALIVSEVTGRDTWDESLKIIGICLTLRALIIIPTVIFLLIGSILFPVQLTDFVNVTAAGVSGYTGYGPLPPFDIREFALEAAIKNLAQLLVIGMLILISTRLQLHITQRILTWYGFPRADLRLIRTVYIAIILLGIALAFGILPLVTDLVLWRWANLLSLSRWVLALFALSLALIGYSWFVLQDGRYGRICPTCNKNVPGSYIFGSHCKYCAQQFHPWLSVHYKDEQL